MIKLKIFIYLFPLFFVVSLIQAQIPDLKNVRIITTHVAGNVYMLEATCDVTGNIGVEEWIENLYLGLKDKDNSSS